MLPHRGEIHACRGAGTRLLSESVVGRGFQGPTRTAPRAIILLERRYTGILLPFGRIENPQGDANAAPASGSPGAARRIGAEAAAHPHTSPRARPGTVSGEGHGRGRHATGRQDHLPSSTAPGTSRSRHAQAPTTLRLVRRRTACGSRGDRSRTAVVGVRPRVPGRRRHRDGDLALRRNPGRTGMGTVRPAPAGFRTDRSAAHRIVRGAPVTRDRNCAPRPGVAGADPPVQLRGGAPPPGTDASPRPGGSDPPGTRAARTRAARLARNRRLPGGAGTGPGVATATPSRLRRRRDAARRGRAARRAQRGRSALAAPREKQNS